MKDEQNIIRIGNRVYAVVTRHGVEVSERLPLHVVDKWDVEAQTNYLIGVARRLKAKLDKIFVQARPQDNAVQVVIKGAKDGQVNGEQATGSKQTSSD